MPCLKWNTKKTKKKLGAPAASSVVLGLSFYVGS